MGFPSPWRLLEFEAHSPWVCLTQYVPLSGFLNLSAVYFFKSVPALFHTGSAFGIWPFRAFSSQAAAIPFGTPCPPDVYAISPVARGNLISQDSLSKWNLLCEKKFENLFSRRNHIPKTSQFGPVPIRRFSQNRLMGLALPVQSEDLPFHSRQSATGGPLPKERAFDCFMPRDVCQDALLHFDNLTLWPCSDPKTLPWSPGKACASGPVRRPSLPHSAIRNLLPPPEGLSSRPFHAFDMHSILPFSHFGNLTLWPCSDPKTLPWSPGKACASGPARRPFLPHSAIRNLLPPPEGLSSRPFHAFEMLMTSLRASIHFQPKPKMNFRTIWRRRSFQTHFFSGVDSAWTEPVTWKPWILPLPATG